MISSKVSIAFVYLFFVFTSTSFASKTAKSKIGSAKKAFIGGRISLGDLCVLPLIGSFLENPYKNMPMLCDNAATVFKEEYPLNVLLNDRFDMPELQNLIECESELKHVLDLNYTNSNPIHFFQALAVDVFKNNLYNEAKPNLVQSLIRKFEKLSEEEKRDINININFSELLEKHFTSLGNYELLARKSLVNCVKTSKVIESMKIVEIKKLYEHLMSLDKGLLRLFRENFEYISERNQLLWLAYIAAFGASEEFTLEILRRKNINFFVRFCPLLIQIAIKLDNHAESYQRIEKYIQWSEKKHLSAAVDEETMQRFQLMRLQAKLFLTEFNEAEFYRTEVQTANLNPKFIFLFTCSVYFTKKNILLNAIMADPRNNLVNQLPHMLGYFAAFPLIDNLQFMFKIVSSMNDQQRNAMLLHQEFLELTLKFYALDRYTVDESLTNANITLKSLNTSLPETLNFRIGTDSGISISPFQCITRLKVTNPEVLTFFIDNYIQENATLGHRLIPSFDVLKNCLESDILFNMLRDGNERFYLNLDLILELVHGSFNLERLNLIIYPLEQKVIKAALIAIRSDFHLSKFEIIAGRNIADLFFDTFDDGITESNYFLVRHIFKYWISTEHFHRINEIDSAEVKSLLKAEFPHETQDIVI